MTLSAEAVDGDLNRATIFFSQNNTLALHCDEFGLDLKLTRDVGPCFREDTLGDAQRNSEQCGKEEGRAIHRSIPVGGLSLVSKHGNGVPTLGPSSQLQKGTALARDPS